MCHPYPFNLLFNLLIINHLHSFQTHKSPLPFIPLYLPYSTPSNSIHCIHSPHPLAILSPNTLTIPCIRITSTKTQKEYSFSKSPQSTETQTLRQKLTISNTSASEHHNSLLSYISCYIHCMHVASFLPSTVYSYT